MIDTGIGISEENQKRLFKLFGMLEDKEQLNKNGIGLGLNIAKQICQAFGGDIEVESEEGRGSNFKFFFDVTPVAEDERNKGNVAAGSEYEANVTNLYFAWEPKNLPAGQLPRPIEYTLKNKRAEIIEAT